MMKFPISGTAALSAAFAILIFLPLAVPSAYWLGVFSVCFIYGIWATSLDFMSGLTGRMNFGHTLFIGGAAYVSAYLNAEVGMSLLQSGFAGIAAAVVLSLAIGFPTLRLQGAYFVLATFTAPAIMQRLVRIFWQVTGGDDGISGLEPLAPSALASYYVCLGCLIFTVLVLLMIANSTVGLRLKAIRGDEEGALGVGIDAAFFKMLAFVLSAIFGALGGVLYVHFLGSATPEMFSVGLSMTIVIMAYVGGLGAIFGAPIAAFMLSFLPEAMRELGQYRLSAYGILIIVIALFFPRGLVAPLWERLVGPRQ